MPPSLARAIAISCSVTVSIGELSSGILIAIRLVRRVSTLQSAGTTSLKRGSRRTSSKVIALRISLSCIDSSSVESGWAGQVPSRIEGILNYVLKPQNRAGVAQGNPRQNWTNYIKDHGSESSEELAYARHPCFFLRCTFRRRGPLG